MQVLKYLLVLYNLKKNSTSNSQQWVQEGPADQCFDETKEKHSKAHSQMLWK